MDDFWKKSFEIKALQKFLNDPKEQYDVVIAEWLYTELGAGVSTVFKCPLIWSSSMDPHTTVLSLIHEHLNPAYTFDHMSVDYSFTFSQRIYQLWDSLSMMYFKWVNNAKQNEDFKDIYESILTKRGQQVPHYDEVRYNASLMLGNSDITTGDGIALPQNYKHIGGYHIKDVVEPLPKDMQEIMDKAEHGVIYFSMGSNLKSAHIPNSVKKELLQVFSELKQTVIWKFEETMPNVPKNVYMVPWAPQQSILAHANIVLFITHGGLLSILETLRFGVPIIGIPFFADQYLNVNRAVAKGFAKRLDFDENAPKSLRIAIKEILDDPSYHQRAKELSTAFNDRMVPPGKELVHWVEHVVKTGGAPHLRSAALHVSWYKKLYLDLISIILLGIVGLIVVLRYTLSTLSASIRISKKKVM
ncbi:unnamed protein product, partial [Brenthis ino]